jgi:hypothetical protein
VLTAELNANLFRIDVDGDDFSVDTNWNDSIPSKEVFVDTSSETSAIFGSGQALPDPIMHVVAGVVDWKID